jgi:hypothetical protein
MFYHVIAQVVLFGLVSEILAVSGLQMLLLSIGYR